MDEGVLLVIGHVDPHVGKRIVDHIGDRARPSIHMPVQPAQGINFSQKIFGLKDGFPNFLYIKELQINIICSVNFEVLMIDKRPE